MAAGLTPDLPLHLHQHTEHTILPRNTQATCTCTLGCTRCHLLLLFSPPIFPRSLGWVTFCSIMKKCNIMFCIIMKKRNGVDSPTRAQWVVCALVGREHPLLFLERPPLPIPAPTNPLISIHGCAGTLCALGVVIVIV